MIAIRAEIRDIETGRMSKNDNPLKNAPYTALDLADDNWTHPYPRMFGCYPAGASGELVPGQSHRQCLRRQATGLHLPAKGKLRAVSEKMNITSPLGLRR